MSTIPLSKTFQARCFRIHNSLDFEQVIWGICWLLQNMSTESGSIPIIKPIGSVSSNIFEQLSSQSGINKNYTYLMSVQVRFCHQMNYGTKFRKKKQTKNDTFTFKAFWIGTVGLWRLWPVHSDIVISTNCSHAWALVGLGRLSPTTDS